jgi:hypothetical protein
VIAVWYPKEKVAKRLGVKEHSLHKLPGFRSIRTSAGPVKHGHKGRVAKVYHRGDVEAMRADRGTVPVKSAKIKSHRKVQAKKVTANQRKIKKANAALAKPNARHHDESIDKLFRRFVVEIKKIDRTIMSVRVELTRSSVEVFGDAGPYATLSDSEIRDLAVSRWGQKYVWLADD